MENPNKAFSTSISCLWIISKSSGGQWMTLRIIRMKKAANIEIIRSMIRIFFSFGKFQFMWHFWLHLNAKWKFVADKKWMKCWNFLRIFFFDWWNYRPKKKSLNHPKNSKFIIIIITSHGGFLSWKFQTSFIQKVHLNKSVWLFWDIDP
jgi:hypothetical protein